MYIADLHIHSRYSRATSRDCTPGQLDLWGTKKGIGLLGTGDFTHPAWRQELSEQLEPAGEGFYALKKEYRIQDETAAGPRPRFVITGEISSIYKKNGRVRKVHSLILLPSLEAAEKLSRKLEQIGNIHSDGRPILGLDCRDLLEITLELCPEAIYVPAHIWTPHFSLFGAFSGFDSAEECYGDLAPHIHAVETGLSSDPPMNWRVSALDGYQLISNSDAHSPSKLGREANLLETDLSYPGLKGALEEGRGLVGTIEFFPEEGKYHMDGHRKCGLCLTPGETEKYGGICPVCGKKITIGVSHRVEQLADRAEGFVPAGAKKFESLVPLPEVIAASMGCSAASVKAQREYGNMLERLGPEFEILREIPLEDIAREAGGRIAEGIRRLREGRVDRLPGFDGEYGKIRLFQEEELANTSGQMDFFSLLGVEAPGDRQTASRISKKGKDCEEVDGVSEKTADQASDAMPGKMLEYVADAISEEAREEAQKEDRAELITRQGRDWQELNPRQREAALAQGGRIAVIAGPGTGKTKTLVAHIIHLVEEGEDPSRITAVTFTNQAAREMRERLEAELGRDVVSSMQIGTFHAICLGMMRQRGNLSRLSDESEAMEIAREVKKRFSLSENPREILNGISRWKSGETSSEKGPAILAAYQEGLGRINALDFDDLLLWALEFAQSSPEGAWREKFYYLCVDEFQDINPLQYRLLMAWSQAGRELFVIGDPDQAIYGFRGADSECFLRLRDSGIPVREIRLEENYRSGQAILKLAQAAISSNPGERGKLCPNRPDACPVRLARAESELGEAIFTAKEINRLTGGIGMLEAQENALIRGSARNRSFGEIAVLYRTHQEARLLETCLRKEGIPYVVAGREEFLADDRVQGTLAFFRSLLGGREEDVKSSLKLLWKLEDDPVSREVYENAVRTYAPLCWETPQALLERWSADWGWKDVEEMKKLREMTVFYSTMEEMLDALLLGVESDLKRCGQKQYRGDAVTLMTLHGSKGLEFPAVILYGVRKGQIPFESRRHQADVQEERRLFYVGLTRAKEELILTTSGEPSAFLEELPRGLLETEVARSERKARTGHQMSLFEMDGFSV